MKHTPGPWTYIGRDIFRDATWPGSIAQAYLIGNNQTEAWAQAEANARLIAAAPDLLEACEALLEHHGWIPDSGENPTPIKCNCDGCQKAHAAIAAARPVTEKIERSV